jgi:competence protein ComEC
VTGVALGTAFLGAAAFGALAALALGALLLVWAGGTDARPSWALLGGVVVAALLGDWRVDPLGPPRPLPWADAARGVVGRVATIPTTDGRFQRFVVDVQQVWDGTTRFPAQARLDVTAPPDPTIEIGDLVWLAGAVTPLGDLQASYADYLRTRRCDGYLFARGLELETPGTDWRRPIAALRRRLDGVLARAAPGDAGALLAGLVTGDDHALTRERRDAFVRTGTSHLTAVSGSNVALLVTLASFGLAGATRRRLLWQVGVVGGVWAYALLVGLEPPVTRAALVATGALLAARVGRRPDLLTLLALSGALMVAVEPDVLWSLSFQLSFAASLGLVAVVPSGGVVGLGAWLKAGIWTAGAAWLATLPLQAAAFGTLSLVAIPANLLLAPLVAVAYPVAFVAAVVGVPVPPLGAAIAAAASLPAELMLRVVDGLGGEAAQFVLPRTGAVPTIALAVICAAILCGWSRDGRRWFWRTLTDAREAEWRPAVMLAGTVAVALVAFGFGLLVR